jgi:IclR family KDG regulon transcriptional repressor
VGPVNSIRMYSQIGRRVPVFCSALGKVLLLGLTPEQRSDVIESLKFTKFTGQTLPDKQALAAAVATAAQQGWAVDNEEHEAGIRCLAAPLYDYTGKIIAAVSVSGAKQVISPERDPEVAAAVLETAGDISRRMGYIKR